MKNLIQSLLFVCFLAPASKIFAQVPVHNSLPTAAATIYLDFDGHFLQNSAWNWSGPLQLGHSGMSTAQMTEIFHRVAEDYRPFNLNITTDSTVYWAAPANQRMRIILTTSHSWYGAAGGIAYVNSFTWGDNTPAFVFTALLGNAKWIAEAASHEAGHTLGLKHQSAYDQFCNKTAEYNPGTGSGEIAWAPIMGVGYYRNFTLWNNGSDPFGCNNYQDDLSIITSALNGFGYRADDHSDNTGATATATPFQNLQFQAAGIIERATDKDYFQFSMPANGNFHLNALPYNIGAGNTGSNLDMQVTLFNSMNQVIGTYNPDGALDAVIDTMLQSGSYYIMVEGKGNMYATEYASLGSYNLAGSFVPFGVLPLRQLELKGKIEKDAHQFNWIIDADEQVVDQTLEVSVDGINWQPAGLLTTSARTFSYLPTKTGLLRYRLLVKFDNGSQYYSNMVALRNDGKGRPQLLGNAVQHTLNISAPSPYEYIITDYSGRLMTRGRITQGNSQVNVASFSPGMYLVQFSNGVQQNTEKFLKQ